jgi:hypothetical protein
MVKIQRVIVVGLLIVLLIQFLFGCVKEKKKTEKELRTLGISIKGIDNFILLENKNNRLVFDSNGTLLIISVFKNLDDTSTKKLVNDKIAILESQYEVRGAPYPGEITQNIVCPEQFKPIKNIINNQYSLANYQLYSTKSLTYGVCVKDLAAYNTFLGFFYCDKKRLFQIELFVPINYEEEFSETLKKISNFKC